MKERENVLETIIKVSVGRHTSKELAKIYNTSKSTFNKDLKPYRKQLGRRIGHRWSLKQVELIFNLLSWPYVKVEQYEIPAIIKALQEKKESELTHQDNSKKHPDKAA